MRIDAFAQIQNMYNMGNNNKQVKRESSRSFSDTLQISSAGKDIQVAKAAVNNAPDIRMDLVSKIKGEIESGTYSVDSDSFAEKLFAKNSRTL